mmetsp:Transcript_80712/g.234074  ORF Transcript_80712/g.234074 Transcript_80712/m.234074 type:complete len:446 (-) Transcript_80712:15-1352(-)
MDAPPAAAEATPEPGSEDAPRASSFFERLGRPRYVLAPMVDQSELPFRLLARRYGAQLCYTPMFNANSFCGSAAYRKELLGRTPPEDRPLIVQFAGHDPDVLLQAARYVEHMCDAVDLNLGCPQAIARRGRYGSFLLEEEDVVVDIVRKLSSQLSVPVTCKIRLFRDDFPRTLRLCKRLEDAGCAMLTVHGRTRFQNKQLVGACDFEKIAAVKAALSIPVIANGGIGTLDDVGRCLEETGVDGVMSSEAALENPALFSGNRDDKGNYVDQNRLAREYLELAHFYLGVDAGAPKCVKAHLFKLLYAGLQDNTDVREKLSRAKSFDEFHAVVEELTTREWSQPGFHADGTYLRHRSWYFRYRMGEACLADGVELPPPAKKGEKRSKKAKKADADEEGDDPETEEFSAKRPRADSCESQQVTPDPALGGGCAPEATAPQLRQSAAAVC